ncbi:hypothetical protein [Actinomadura roseirufa]|uniref:hypothetical protein n=1 Tax=Actinomadura roseirufa TaxID=2094049 RepID=UPI0010415D11|nr:hypothetical protein [Actinomadura roseirufa]
MNRTKALVMGSAALLVALAGIAYLVLAGGDELRYKTQSALRKSLAVTAAAELQARGLKLSAPLKCADLPGWTKQKLRASCTGTTTDKRDVRVLGSGERKTHKTYYTILVGGHPVVENVLCLGADCRRDKG